MTGMHNEVHIMMIIDYEVGNRLKYSQSDIAHQENKSFMNRIGKPFTLSRQLKIVRGSCKVANSIESSLFSSLAFNFQFLYKNSLNHLFIVFLIGTFPTLLEKILQNAINFPIDIRRF